MTKEQAPEPSDLRDQTESNEIVVPPVVEVRPYVYPSYGPDRRVAVPVEEPSLPVAPFSHLEPRKITPSEPTI